jgi:hypothetical protein
VTAETAISVAVWIAVAALIALAVIWFYSLRLFVKHAPQATLRMCVMTLALIATNMFVPEVTASVDTVIDLGPISTKGPLQFSNAIASDRWITFVVMLTLLAFAALLRSPAGDSRQ